MTGGQSAAQMLAEFHNAFGQPFGHGDIANSTLRRKLHEEEFEELEEAHERLLTAFDAADLAAVAHELADVVYVAYGSAHSLGIPLDAVLAEVHRANMSKFDEHGRPVLREDGKVLKSERFVPADVPRVLAAEELADTDLQAITDGDHTPGCGRPGCPCRANQTACEEWMGIAGETGQFCPRCGWTERCHPDTAAVPTDTEETQ